MLHDLDLFYRDIGPNSARVFARLPKPLTSGEWTLRGQVRGPFTTRGHTLPSTSGFLELPEQGFLLSHARVVDPCTWSPDSPNLYDVTMELRRNNDVVEVEKRRIGIRDLRPQRQNLLLDAKRCVLRGTWHTDEEPLNWWNEATTRVMDRFEMPWLEQASKDGVLTIIDAEAYAKIDFSYLRQVAKYASAAMVIVPNPCPLPEDVRLVAPNLLFAQRWNADKPLAAWAHVCWAAAQQIVSGELQVASIALPLIAERKSTHATLAEARAACDTLQAELAPFGQFAGYMV